MKKYIFSMLVLIVAFAATNLQAQVAECVAFPQGGAIVGWVKHSFEGRGRNATIHTEERGVVVAIDILEKGWGHTYDPDNPYASLSAGGYKCEEGHIIMPTHVKHERDISDGGGSRAADFLIEFLCVDPMLITDVN